ncbi:MAG: tyrocidine synthetase-3, partial [Phenylobacterium sp.]
MSLPLPTSEQSKVYWCDLHSKRDQFRLTPFYRNAYKKTRQQHHVVTTELLQPTALRLSQYCQRQQVSPLAVLTAVTAIYFSRTSELNELVLAVLLQEAQQGIADSLVYRVEPQTPFLALVGAFEQTLASHHGTGVTDGQGDWPDIQVGYEAGVVGGVVAGVVANAPLSILLVESQGDSSLQLNLNLKLQFDLDYFNQAEITLLSQRLLLLLDQGLDQGLGKSSQAVDTMTLLTAQERAQVLTQWNQTDAEYPATTLHQLFETQAEQTPKSPAVVFGQQSLSYAELNQQANQLARLIRTQYQQTTGEALQPNTLIALYLNRDINTVIAILAVLKAGAAYVPISTDYPQSRVQFILNDTGAAMMLTQQAHLGTLDAWVSELQQPLTLIPIELPIEQPIEQVANKPLLDNLDSLSSATDLAYVIYTSGTTGQPKGVMVEHQAVMSFAINNRYIDADKVSHVASLSSYAFDGFIFDAFFTLLNGACVHLYEQSLFLQPDALFESLTANKIDAFFVTTALVNQLLSHGGLAKTQVRQILFGGEAADITVLGKALDTLDDIRLIHVYGPTETVVYASAFHFEADHFRRGSSDAPIGSALTNKRLLVLDSQLQPVPVGVCGELYIGGAGLARGYLNRDDLSALCFIDNPFACENDLAQGFNRLYKTGDVVRWLVDEQTGLGNLVYVGRNDSQVKIRGFRVELDEVQRFLTELPQVKQAVVVDVKPDNSDSVFLAAYVVAEQTIETNALRAVLREALLLKLPDYMVPSAFTFLAAIPLTVNGKLDRRALPAPEFVSEDNYVPARNALEQQLCDLWQHVLGLKQVGIEDNFFRIGGTSISAIRLTTAIRQAL